MSDEESFAPIQYILHTDRFRLLIFVERKSGVAFEEFERSWNEVSGELDLPGLHSLGIARYEKMIVDQDKKAELQSMGATVLNYDGIILIEAGSLEGFREYITKRFVPEEAETRILELENSRYAICHVAPIITTKPASRENGGMRLIVHLKRKTGTTSQEFSKHWMKKHAGVVADFPGARDVIRLYDQNHVIKELSLGELTVNKSTTIGMEKEWDGVPFLDAESLENLFVLLGEENFARVRQADEARFLDMKGSACAPVRVVTKLELGNR
ncbi:hypothetical protein E1B28_001981 [Marasmius oreades]|uniref:EthD domain-containing protein n=1 Tax=Marasmius oreades TaxID=181124 RepID=A0A9P7V4I0_9AGAR|nr:uncharacterized protein E1B28_001981 [Marasmius oreades]KAG7100206.1 hypothetical protein E1B28_001981 [Marasmius oreades]